MAIRIGRVSNVYPSEGKVQVVYEDSRSSSMPLSMLTMNREYLMPDSGERVLTLHLENGSSKGFVLGTFYGGLMRPKSDAGYRKDFGEKAYVTCTNGNYMIHAGKVSIEADDIILKCANGNISVGEILERLEKIEKMLGTQK